jgi:hypothetical protein
VEAELPHRRGQRRSRRLGGEEPDDRLQCGLRELDHALRKLDLDRVRKREDLDLRQRGRRRFYRRTGEK